MPDPNVLYAVTAVVVLGLVVWVVVVLSRPADPRPRTGGPASPPVASSEVAAKQASTGAGTEDANG